MSEATDDAPRCPGILSATPRDPAALALSYACVQTTAATPEEEAAAQEHLATLARLAYDPGERGFAPQSLGNGVVLDVAALGPLRYDFADRAEIDGDRAPGILPGRGVPLVGFRPNAGEADAHYPPEGIFTPVTLTADVGATPEGLRITLRPVTPDEARQGGWADAGAQAYLRLLERTRLNQESSRGFRDPSKLRIHGNGIYLIEPYDPERIPVLMIHGLRSNPEIWRTLTRRILSDPDLHARFQVWHAFYPTGVPPFYTASRIRMQLNDVQARFDPEGDDVASRDVALIGHSMGGIVARALVTEDEGALWRRTFLVPPEDLAVSEERRQDFLRLLTLNHEPEIGFVGFVNTPHRGSASAEGWIGRFASSMVMLPMSFQRIFTEDPDYLPQTTPEMRAFLMGGGPTSVEALSPRHPLLQAMADLPTAPGVEAVSVVGVRGGTECLQRPGCVATDGVVPYESAHLGFGTEKVVRSGHGSYDDPEAVEFLLSSLRAWAGRQ
jgi:pimeloyl-ACP methyl ester carboxylesterase